MSDSKQDSIADEPLTIEVSAIVYERFEQRRQETETPGAPAMSPETYLSALLDTEKAVEEGFYDAE